MSENLGQPLQKLAKTIADCRVCDGQGLEVSHCPPLFRGNGSKVFVVGEQPGSQEQSKGVAFSGPAGKRLRDWLIRAGVAEEEEGLFAVCYFTSLIKCRVDNSELRKAFRNCRVYLERQLTLVQPEIVCTLGQKPLEYLYGIKGPLESVVGNLFREKDLHDPGLFPIHGANTKIIPLPHPSPLSRWLNDGRNQDRLDEALKHITNHFSGDQQS